MIDPRPHACPKCHTRERAHNTTICSACGADVTPHGIFVPPFRPLNGMVTVQQLPFKPSKLIEVLSIDRADETEGIVVALSDCRYGRRKTKGGWEHTGITFPHELHLFDRVVFEGCYQDDSFHRLNGVKYRTMDSWEYKGVIMADQPSGWEDPFTGEMLPDKHPLIGA